MSEERLQKVIAAAGLASRRGAEALIEAGRVTVDGRIASLGDRADPSLVSIAVDGRPIPRPAAFVHLVANKPPGVTSTVRDRHAERTVVQLVPPGLLTPGLRLYPVGRLDRDSEGLILLTNDGAWADRLLHPRHGIEREYAIGLRRPLPPGAVAALRDGIELDEGLAAVEHLRPATGIETRRLASQVEPPFDPTLAWYRATIRQGWRRQLRRMFGAIGEPVARLVRVRIGPVRLDGLSPGAVRTLTSAEVRALPGGAARTTSGDASGG
jgi:23S rRNA pseudouridine2605 synthase